MLFASQFIFAGAMLLVSVTALPQGSDDDALASRAKKSCPAGFYPKNNNCIICPAGNTCDGRSGPAQCATGHAAPNNGTVGACPACPPGTFQDKKGSKSCIPCAAGSFAPYPGTKSCRLCPAGFFQGLRGQKVCCGSCCGWEARGNGKSYPSNCTSRAKPNASPHSGGGCTSKKVNCKHGLTCMQNPITGSCPVGSALLTHF
ncbi:hypothetical protein R3P38DRAFT_2903888 [Favolaschia claudopus]|uniref:Tyrosine-protein kinase ephrin type A/B receptor-like domain-containing protein n=1 Tax=Favolaschia claudopus TaxID=2862362 RepID=A0AAW0CG03_9AGAR